MSAPFPITAGEARALMQAYYGSRDLSEPERAEANRRYGLFLCNIEAERGGFLGMTDCEFATDPRRERLGITDDSRCWDAAGAYELWREMAEVVDARTAIKETV